MSPDDTSGTQAWPPPPGPGDRFEQKRLVGRDHPPSVVCRLVRLWGRDVWLDDETGRVWCPTCLDLVDVVDLARADNRHPQIGLPYRADGRLFPMGDDRSSPPDPGLRW